MDFRDNLRHDFVYILIYDFVLIVAKNPLNLIIAVSNRSDWVIVPAHCYDTGVGVLPVLRSLDIPHLLVVKHIAAYFDSLIYKLLPLYLFIHYILQEVTVDLKTLYVIRILFRQRYVESISILNSVRDLTP